MLASGPHFLAGLIGRVLSALPGLGVGLIQGKAPEDFWMQEGCLPWGSPGQQRPPTARILLPSLSPSPLASPLYIPIHDYSVELDFLETRAWAQTTGTLVFLMAEAGRGVGNQQWAGLWGLTSGEQSWKGALGGCSLLKSTGNWIELVNSQSSDSSLIVSRPLSGANPQFPRWKMVRLSSETQNIGEIGSNDTRQGWERGSVGRSPA